MAFAFQDVQTKVKSFNRIAVPDPLPEPSGGALLPPCFVVDVSANPAVSITWSIPFTDASASTASFRASKPQVVLSHLIAHQGPGSLSAWLREKGWVPANLGPKVSAQNRSSSQNLDLRCGSIKVRLSPEASLSGARWSLQCSAFLAALRQSQKKGGGRDVLSEAADEVSALADVAWRLSSASPARPGTRLGHEVGATPCGIRLCISTDLLRHGVGSQRRCLEKLGPDREGCSLHLSTCSSGFVRRGGEDARSPSPSARANHPFQHDSASDHTDARSRPWAGTTASFVYPTQTRRSGFWPSSTPPDWWQMPAKNLYLSKAEKIERSSLLAPGKAGNGEAKQEGKWGLLV